MKVSKGFKGCLKTNWLTIATFAGVVIGVIIGISVRQLADDDDGVEWSQKKRLSMYVSYKGDLFLRALKCIIIPLIVPSLIIAIGTLDLKLSGRIGGRAVGYYLSTTLIAIVIGIILVISIKPGNGVEKDDSIKAPPRNITTADTLMDLVRNLVPPNIIQACTQQSVTQLTYPMKEDNYTKFDDKNTWPFKTVFKDNSNILGLVAWSIMFGIAIANVGEKAKPVLDFFVAFTEIMMTITQFVINFAPIGVCFLVAGQVLKMKSFEKTFLALGAYFGTVLLGLFIHGLIVLPIIFALFTRTLPFRYIANMGNALFTAFGTASSSATLPVTIAALEERNNIDSRISRFVLPIGATINMDGTALYEAVAAIFIAQVNGMELTASEVVAISITATAASIGAAGIPQAGLVTMVMVLNTVGLPSTDIALILSIDWLLDRFRTTINVLGDALGAGIVYHLSKKELEKMDKEHQGTENVLRVEAPSTTKAGNGNVNETFEMSTTEKIHSGNGEKYVSNL